MATSLIRGVLNVIRDEYREIQSSSNPPPRPRRTLIKNVGKRMAETVVNTYFPTNESGNNMSRG